MNNMNDGDLSTDEDEEEKKYRLDRIKGKSSDEIEAMNKRKMKCYTVMFNVFQVKLYDLFLDKRFNDC